MSIQAIAIPQKHVKVSALIADADLDLDAYSLMADDIRAGHTSLFIDNPFVMNGTIDSLLKSQYFTIADSGTTIRQVLGGFFLVTSDVYSDVLPVAWCKIPAGAISGNLGFCATIWCNDAPPTVYIRPYNFTKSAYIGVEQSLTGTTHTLKYQTINLQAGVLEPGDIVLLHAKVSDPAYIGFVDLPYIRGTVTPTFKPGTVSWI